MIDQDRAAESDPEVEAAKLRTFAHALMKLEDGQFNADLTATQADVVQAMREAVMLRGGRAKGSITVKVELELEDGIVNVRTSFTTARPKLPRARTVLWPMPDGTLVTHNPAQRALPLHSVATATQPAMAPRAVGGPANPASKIAG